MAKRKIGELPSGNVRKKIYDHSELCFDEQGKPIIDPKTGKQRKKMLIYIVIPKKCVPLQSILDNGDRFFNN